MESSVSVSEISSSQNQHVLVSRDLMQLLSSVKKMPDATSTTWSEVLDGVKTYILERGLFDQTNPFNIRLGNDELGSVLGLSDFTIRDVMKILRKFVIPVSSKVTDSAEVICSYSVSEKSLKRKSEVSDSEETIKKVCPPAEYDSPSDSAYSIQDYETEFVRDTSDDNLCFLDENNEVQNFPGGSILTVAETYDLEYEVQSDTSENSEEKSASSETDSEFEEVLHSAIFSILCKTDSDREFWADDSSDESHSSSFDVEISEEDQWRCKTCSTLNDPVMRSCAVCWTVRRGWLCNGERTKHRTRKRKPRNRRRRSREANRILSNKESPTYTNHYDMPSTSKESSLPSSSHSEASEITKNPDLNAKLCIICCENRVNSSIIHGKVGHSISCYRCARKLQKKDERCPICRRVIERVVYLISS